MNLTFRKKHKSIGALESPRLPNFTILTGLNGAGKTHFLEAIQNGSIEVENVVPSKINYFNFINFRVNESLALNGAQISHQAKGAWQTLLGQDQNPKTNWIGVAQKIFNQEIINKKINEEYLLDLIETKEAKLWNLTGPDLPKEILDAIAAYEAAIEAQIFEHPNFKQKQNHRSIAYSIKKLGKPIHILDSFTFEKAYFPVAIGNNHLSVSLGALFTRYKVEQFLWVVREFQGKKDSKYSPNEIMKDFEKRNIKPWETINEIMKNIHELGGSGDVFNFRITDPEDIIIHLENYQDFSFSPKIIDNEFGDPRSFGELSSGEQVLLALVLSIFQSVDHFELPKLLLLDEVDASLHPSMIKALLGTIQQVFVDKGVGVILATHSPTTVSISDPESVHLIDRKRSNVAISHAEQDEAVRIVTEGFATLSDGSMAFGQVQEGKINVITEGNNIEYFEKYFSLNGIHYCNFIRGLEDRSGVQQLHKYADILLALNPKDPFLIIYDCDAEPRPGADKIVTMSLPQNSSNKLVPNGIENMFPESLFKDDWFHQSVHPDRPIQKKFLDSKKGQFKQMVLARSEIQDFALFDFLLPTLDQLRPK